VADSKGKPEAATTDPQPEEDKYTLDQLEELAPSFGATPEAVAGALALQGGNKKYFTLGEAEEAVKAFNKHKPDADREEA
jgi:N-acetylneuraminic acid mutarotase